MRSDASAVSGARSASINAEHLQRSSGDKQGTPPDFDEVEAAAFAMRVHHGGAESSDTGRRPIRAKILETARLGRAVLARARRMRNHLPPGD